MLVILQIVCIHVSSARSFHSTTVYRDAIRVVFRERVITTTSMWTAVALQHLTALRIDATIAPTY